LTLGEFLHPLANASQKNLVLAVMYYLHRYKGSEAVTTADIKDAFTAAKHAKGKRIQHAAVLNQAVPYVESPGGKADGRLLWKLTDTGEKHIRKLLGLPDAEPEVEHDVAALSKLAAKVADESVRDYLEEAIKCLGVGARRAAVVFTWTGAVATMRNEIFTKGVKQVDQAIQKHDARTPTFKKKADFENVTDATLLEVAHTLGVYDKSEKKRLKEGLDLRNDCGHPVKYKAGEKKVSSFIDDLIGIVFT